MPAKLQDTITAILTSHRERPVLGFILSAGLDSYADTLVRQTVIPFDALPHFPRPTVLGHSGTMVLGEAEGVPAVALKGRVHYYEGFSMREVTYPARVLGCLGVRQLIITNAAGGINLDFRPGDRMLISDHLNLMGANPLIGENLEDLGPRFPDMSEAYPIALRDVAKRFAARMQVPLKEGVYAGVSGPNYETPAEIRMLRALGADAVGMSTVPEVIVANHAGIRVLGISCITNMAAGVLPRKLTHQEVLDTTEAASGQFTSWMRSLVPALAALEAGRTGGQP